MGNVKKGRYSVGVVKRGLDRGKELAAQEDQMCSEAGL